MRARFYHDAAQVVAEYLMDVEVGKSWPSWDTIQTNPRRTHDHIARVMFAILAGAAAESIRLGHRIDWPVSDDYATTAPLNDLDCALRVAWALPLARTPGPKSRFVRRLYLSVIDVFRNPVVWSAVESIAQQPCLNADQLRARLSAAIPRKLYASIRRTGPGTLVPGAGFRANRTNRSRRGRARQIGANRAA